LNRIIEIAPGQTLPRVELAQHVPAFGIVRMRRETNGQLTPLLRTWEPEVRLTKDLPEQLGLELDYRTLSRLAASGSALLDKPAPRLTLISIPSLVAHMDECADPEFWTPERTARFNAARAEGI